jgi:hypothetical protein
MRTPNKAYVKVEEPLNWMLVEHVIKSTKNVMFKSILELGFLVWQELDLHVSMLQL